MLTRVAQSIYLINRYLERADNVARFVDVCLSYTLDSPNRNEQQWQDLVEMTGDRALSEERYERRSPEDAIQFLIFDQDNPNSIISCLQAAREKARTIRQFISEEVWRQVNNFYLIVKEADPKQSLCRLTQFLTAVQEASYLFAGAVNETMSRDEGWHFGKVGKFLERVEQTSRLLEVKYFAIISAEDDSNAGKELGWIALLKSASAYQMYRKHHHQITSQGVVEFLILNEEFPHSIRFCLLEAEASLHKITGTSVEANNSVERSLGQLRSQLDITVEEILQKGLAEFLNDLRQQASEVDRKIDEVFFALRKGS